MSTVRERIVQAAFVAITTDVPGGVPEPVRTRLVSPSAEQLPALTVYQGREIVNPTRDEKEGRSSRSKIVRRALDLHVEAVVAATGDGADELVDPLLAWATKSLVGAGTMEGLSDDPADESGTVFEYEQADFAYVRARMTLRYHYQSLRDDAEMIDESDV